MFPSTIKEQLLPIDEESIRMVDSAEYFEQKRGIVSSFERSLAERIAAEREELDAQIESGAHTQTEKAWLKNDNGLKALERFMNLYTVTGDVSYLKVVDQDVSDRIREEDFQFTADNLEFVALANSVLEVLEIDAATEVKLESRMHDLYRQTTESLRKVDTAIAGGEAEESWMPAARKHLLRLSYVGAVFAGSGRYGEAEEVLQIVDSYRKTPGSESAKEFTGPYDENDSRVFERILAERMDKARLECIKNRVDQLYGEEYEAAWVDGDNPGLLPIKKLKNILKKERNGFFSGESRREAAFYAVKQPAFKISKPVQMLLEKDLVGFVNREHMEGVPLERRLELTTEWFDRTGDISRIHDLIEMADKAHDSNGFRERTKALIYIANFFGSRRETIRTFDDKQKVELIERLEALANTVSLPRTSEESVYIGMTGELELGDTADAPETRIEKQKIRARVAEILGKRKPEPEALGLNAMSNSQAVRALLLNEAASILLGTGNEDARQPAEQIAEDAAESELYLLVKYQALQGQIDTQIEDGNEDNIVDRLADNAAVLSRQLAEIKLRRTLTMLEQNQVSQAQLHLPEIAGKLTLDERLKLHVAIYKSRIANMELERARLAFRSIREITSKLALSSDDEIELLHDLLAT